MQGTWIRRGAGHCSLIFIHGVLSDGESCWQHPNGTYWPELVSADDALKAFGIYVFTYKTGIFSGTYRLGDVVDALKEHLALDEVLQDHKSSIFVCHSMGGIVARKFLVQQASELIAREIGVGLFLIASPSLGSSYAEWLSPIARFLKHSQADALRFSQTNSWLMDLDVEFKNLKEAGRLFLSGKELIEDIFIVFPKVLHKQVVEPFTGARYFGDPYKVPDSDHFSICKVPDADSVQHKMLRKFALEFLAKRGRPESDDKARPIESPSRTKLANPPHCTGAGPGCLLDIQSVRSPHSSTLVSEVRFSITNASERYVKLTSILLEVLKAIPISRTMLLMTAAPVDEHVLFANIDEKTTAVELFTRPHMLAPSETDGFFLKVSAVEGIVYTVRLTAGWHYVPNDQSQVCSSEALELEHPIHSVSGLSRLADAQILPSK
jgi:hypothetical protein